MNSAIFGEKASLEEHRGNILIVDDTIENLQLVSTLLGQHGYEVRAVKSGSAALMGIKAQPPDLILLDINMPGMSGYEVCEQLKANPETREIPILFISSLNEVFDKLRAFEVGGVDYITKPFQVEEVLARVETHLTIRRLQTELVAALTEARSLNQRIKELATVEERNRIAREIHDSIGHALVALNIQMETAIALWDSDRDRALSILQAAKDSGSHALQATRQSVSELRFDPLQGESLATAIGSLVREFQHTTNILPDCQIALDRPTPDLINVAVYRLVQEGFTNICKHARATQVRLKIESTGSSLSLELSDNGNGFQVNECRSGFGLQGMGERIVALGGQLQIGSKPGSGCRITVNLPLTS